MISEQSIVVVTNNQVYGELHDGDIAILNLKDGVYYGLNPIGGRIWNLIQKPIEVSQVRDKLLEEYEVEQERCMHEVIALLEELYTRGLIEVRNGPVA
jgi:hypothetical protein